MLIGFFHEYLLPVSVLLLLAVILWYHPGREEMAEALEAQEQPRSVRAVSGTRFDGFHMQDMHRFKIFYGVLES